MGITLFPDQQEALNRVVAAYHACPVGGRALVVAPTAWGKTIFFSSLIQALHLPLQGAPVLIIAHRDELLDQAREKILMISPTAIVGKVGGGIWDYGAPITVASIDTIGGAKHLAKLASFGYRLVIIDESHHSVAPKYQKVLEVLKEAFQLGVTATPERLDGKSLEPIFGSPLFQMTIIDAIKARRLSDIKATAIRTEVNLDDVKSKKNMDGEVDFDLVQLNLAINTPERNRRVVEAYSEHTPGARAICFGVTIEHAEAIASAFCVSGIPAMCITGSTPRDERKKIYSQFEAGEVKVLTNVMVLTEGFDCPAIECVIMARPTQSRSLYMQCIGRGMRLSPGKVACTILDLTDNVKKHKLMPMSLKKVLKIEIQEEELASEAIMKAEEQEKRDKLERMIPEKRLKDIQINLLEEPMAWMEKDNGMFVIEVGLEKHRIAIIPSREQEGLYDVCARLAPMFSTPQKWMSIQPIEACQALAERRIRALLSDPRGVALVDVNARWKTEPVSPGQVKMLKWFKIPLVPGMTKGQAADLIDARKERIEEQKKAAAIRKMEKQQRREVTA